VDAIEHRCRAHASVETGDCAVCLRISRDKLAELADELVIERNEAREQHRGAVEERDRLRALLDKHGLRVGDDGESLVYANPSGATLRNLGEQSSPAGCSLDPKVARPPHTCSGEQS
jgi:hypothetical protein